MELYKLLLTTFVEANGMSADVEEKFRNSSQVSLPNLEVSLASRALPVTQGAGQLLRHGFTEPQIGQDGVAIHFTPTKSLIPGLTQPLSQGCQPGVHFASPVRCLPPRPPRPPRGAEESAPAPRRPRPPRRGEKGARADAAVAKVRGLPGTGGAPGPERPGPGQAGPAFLRGRAAHGPTGPRARAALTRRRRRCRWS